MLKRLRDRYDPDQDKEGGNTLNLEKLRKSIKKSRLYNKSKQVYSTVCMRYRRCGRYTFVDRSKHSERLCIILAGYKEFLYPSVLGRIERFAPKDMDICVLTSGIVSSPLISWCERCGWSYLSTKRNNVSLILNIAIHLHPTAKYIYKLDEDIFVTENYFENMLRAYHHAGEGAYTPGVIAPLIPVNGYGHVRVLEKLHLQEEYARLFGKPKHDAGDFYPVVADSEAAKFFWGEGGLVPSIDEMNERFSSEPLVEYPCAIKFSIGAIFFPRETWLDMKMFPVSVIRNLGIDERRLCYYCCIESRPILVSENVLVGHFGFQYQTQDMKEYFKAHQTTFLLP